MRQVSPYLHGSAFLLVPLKAALKAPSRKRLAYLTPSDQMSNLATATPVRHTHDKCAALGHYLSTICHDMKRHRLFFSITDYMGNEQKGSRMVSKARQLSGSCHKRQKNKRQRRKRQTVTAKREKSQTPKVLTAILT